MLDTTFAISFVDDQASTIIKDLYHLPICVMYRLTLWDSAVDLTAQLKSQGTCLPCIFSISFVTEGKG